MKNLVIRFITEGDFISDAIRLVTFSEWSHTEAQTETGSWIGAHADGGVQEREPNYCTPTRERRYSIAVTDEAYAAGMAFLRSKIGTKYDFTDILGLMIHHDLSTPNRRICSWLMCEYMFATSLRPLNVLPGWENLVTPETLHLSPLFYGRCIFEIPKER